MSTSADGSTSAAVFVEGNVVQNVVGLRQKMGFEGHLLSLGTGVNEGIYLRWGETFGDPVPIGLVEQVPLISLISVPQQVAVGTGQGPVFMALPELADGEIPAETLGVNRRRRGVLTGGECLSPMKFSSVGSRIDHLERRQAAQQGLIGFEVGNEAEKAVSCRVAVEKWGGNGIRSLFLTPKKNGKPVYEIPLSL